MAETLEGFPRVEKVAEMLGNDVNFFGSQHQLPQSHERHYEQNLQQGKM